MSNSEIVPAVYKRSTPVDMSHCDFSGRLSIAGTVDLFMDLAAEVTEALGIGVSAMAKDNFYWLTIRTRCRFHRRPRVSELVEVATWAHAMQRAMCNRYYTLSKDGEVLIEGKTEWLVYDTETDAVSAQLGPVFSNYAPCEDVVCKSSKSRVGRKFLPEEKLGDYRVLPTDIDIGHHMNNVAYIRAIMSLIPTAQQAAMNISEFEISYHNPALEGETLAVFRRETEDGFEIGMFKEDGTLASCSKYWVGEV